MRTVEDLCMNAQFALRSAIGIISLFSGGKKKKKKGALCESLSLVCQASKSCRKSHRSTLFCITNSQNWRLVLNDVNLNMLDHVQAQ